MTTPKVPNAKWDALAHRREEAWTTVLDAEAELKPLRERDADRARREVEQADEEAQRFPISKGA